MEKLIAQMHNLLVTILRLMICPPLMGNCEPTWKHE